MPFRGYFTLNGAEIANTSRVAAHVGANIPTMDLGLISGESDCSLTRPPPNRLPDLSDSAYWSTVLAPGGVLDAVHRKMTWTGDGTTDDYLYFNQSPGTGLSAFTTAPGEQWHIEITLHADPANAGPVSEVFLGATFYDSGLVHLSTVQLGGTVTLAAGQTQIVSGAITVPSDHAYIVGDFVVIFGVISAGYKVSVSLPIIYRVGDAPGLLAVPADSQAPLSDDFPLLYTPANGSRLYSPGLALIGDCWDDSNLCFGCREVIQYDDSWDGLQEFLTDTIYRPELAPWYSTQVPESAEFGGIWVMDVKGLNVATVQLDITENFGDGGAPNIPRDPSRKVTFDALLVACTNAGLEYGLQWLTCQLRAVNSLPTYGVLKYLAAHPGHSAVDPNDLLREAYGVVMTQSPTISASVNAGRVPNQQATVYRVEWELTITVPKIYLPSIPLEVTWDTMTLNPIKWVHATDCGAEPAGCDPDPKLFAEGCDIETITEVMSPPPSCGGCLPVCQIATYVYTVPSFDFTMICKDSAVTLTVTNVGDDNLNIQAYFRRCNVRDECDMGNQWPLQITSLPPTAELVLDGPTGTYWVNYLGRQRRPFGMVGTPTGAPWRPAIMDRSLCWEFVVLAPSTAAFEVDMRLADRQA